MGSIRRALTRRTAGVAVWSLVIGTAIGLAPTAAYGAAEPTPSPSATVTSDPTPATPGDDTGSSVTVTVPAEETTPPAGVEPTPEPTSSVDPDPQPEVTSSPTPTATPDEEATPAPDEDATPGPGETSAAETPAAPTPEPTTATPTPSKAPVAGTRSVSPPVAPSVASTASVSGKVTGPGNVAVEYIDVDAYLWYDYGDGSGYWSWQGYASTDAQGIYTIADLEPGTYTLQFQTSSDNLAPEWWNNKLSQSEATSFTLTAGQSKTAVNAQLATGAILEGSVTDEDGNPLDSVRVSLYRLNGDGQWDFQRDEWTGGDGAFAIERVATGTYALHFTPDGGALGPEWWDDQPDAASATEITVTAGQTVQNLNAALNPGAEISGVVTMSDAAVTEAEVTLYRTVADEWGTSWEWIASTVTEADGSYTFGGLGAGSYSVRFASADNSWIEEWWDDAADQWSATPIELAPGQSVTNIDADVSAGGSISGTVSGPGGYGAADVPVVLYREESYAGDVYWNWYDSTTSASDGSYAFTGLTPGTYTLEFGGTPSAYVAEWWNDKPSQWQADSFTLSAGQVLTDFDALLTTGASVSGKVTGPDGSPLESVDVSLYVRAGESGWNGAGLVQTSSDGTYVIAGLLPNTYTVCFSSWSGAFVPQCWDDQTDLNDADSFALTAGQAKTGVNAQLATGGILAGSVTDEEGNPLEFTSVSLYQMGSDGYWEFHRYEWTEANGAFAIEGLATGTYTLYFEPGEGALGPEWWNDQPDRASATPIAVTAGKTTGGLKAVLSAGAQISGTVTLSGAPIADAEVTLYKSVAYEWGASWDWTASTYTEADGSYRFGGVGAGTYAVRFSSGDGAWLEEWWDNAEDEWSATPIELTSGQVVDNIDADVSAGGSISGKVTKSGGAGVGDVPVVLHRQESYAGDVYWNWYTSTTSASNGTYTFANLPPGTYTVEFGGSSSGYVAEWWNDKPTEWDADSFALSSGQVKTGVNAQLVEGAVISGKVTGPGGAALEHADVYVYQKVNSPDSTYWTYAGRSETSSGGTYSVTGLAAGTYTVSFLPPGDSDLLDEWWNDQADQSTATAFDLTAGQKKTGVNAQLAKGATISGKVTKSGGAAVTGASVVLYRQQVSGSYSYWSWVDSTTTAADGTYSFHGLRTGNYTTAVKADGQNLVSEWWNNKTSSTADAIPLTAGQQFTANTELAVGATISGVVTGAGGVPVAGASVTIYEHGSGSGGSGWWYVTSITTDSSGAYAVPGLAAGEYTVGYAPPSDENLLGEWWNDKSSLSTATGFTLSAGQTKSGVNAQLAVGGTITATVTGASGAAAAGVRVTVYTKSGAPATYDRWTDSAGKATFVGLRAGDYTMGAFGSDGSRFLGGSALLSEADFVSLAAAETKNVTVSFTGVTVTGTVRVAGTGAIVTSGTVQLSSGTGGSGVTTPIKADGTYSFTGIRAGDYTLSVTPTVSTLVETWWDGATSEWDADYFSVGSSPVSKNVSVARAGSVSGTLAAFNGDSGAGVYLYLYRVGPGGQSDYSDSFRTSDTGQFSFSGVAPGTYSIAVWRPSAQQWLGDVTSAADAQTFAVNSGANTSVGSISFGGVGATVSGTITAPGGASTAAAYVSLYAEDGRYYGGSSITDSAYTFAGLPAGTYKLSVSLAGYAPYWYGGTNASNATAFTLTTGQKRTINVALVANNGAISGKVTAGSSGGAAVASAQVYLYSDAMSWSSIAWATTDSAGQFSLPASVFGGSTYDIRVYAPDGSLAGAERSFTAKSGAQTQNFVLDASGRITGTLTDRVTGGAVSGVEVHAFAADGTSTTGITNPDGSYNLDSLRPGSYNVRFGSYSSGYSSYISGYSLSTPYYASEWLGGTVAQKGSTTLVVAAGATKAAGAGQVEQAAVITGRVSGTASGSPAGWLQGVAVSAYTTSGELADTSWTGGGAPGSFVLAVKAGTYKVCATGPEGTDFTSACWTASGSSSSGSPSSGGNVRATRGKTTSGIDIVLGDTPTITSAVPKITGTATVGQTLTAVPGAWTSGTSFAYQWLADGAAISGATSSTLKLSNSHVGKKISVKVTGSKSGYIGASATSAATSTVTGGVLTAPTPTISGSAVVGSKLTAKAGSWTSGTTLKYQWYANGSAISKAVASTYTVTSTVIGKTITVKVTGSKSGYVTAAKTSKATGKVLGVLTAPTPTISGSAVVGSKLTAKAGSWTSGTTLKYQWYANGSAIKGATASTFTVSTSQVEKTITVKVTGSKSGYVTASKTSKATGKVLKVATPTISGTAKVGKTLTVKAGSWTSGTKLTYQWYASGSAIKGASKSTVKLTSAQAGKTITVKVTGSKSGYVTASKTSKATGKVAK